MQNKPLFATQKRKSYRVGVVTAKFNSEVTERLEQGALKRLSELGVDATNIERVRVPGAFEIPLAAKWLLESGCDGVVALGAVIRGDTAHFDYVCSSVERGCTLVQLDLAKPVAFGVLTTDTEEQAMARAGGHMGNKGAEASDVILEMLDLRVQIVSKVQTNSNPKESHDV